MKRDRLIAIAALGAVLALTAFAFAPVRQNDFVNWDDQANLLDNTSYRGLSPEHLRWMFTTFHAGHYQPLAWLTLGADYLVWGIKPLGYHLTSGLFHLANTALVFALAMRLLGRGRDAHADERAHAERELGAPPRMEARETRVVVAAAFAAAFFAIHPLRVESVAWATARRDVVSGFFFLVALLAYVGMVDAAARARAAALRIASIAAFALALLAKSIVAPMPVLLLVLDVYPLRRIRAEGASRRDAATRLIVEKLPYFALSLLFVVVGMSAQSANEDTPGLSKFGVFDRVAIACYGLGFYVRKTLLPSDLSAAHILPPSFGPLSPPFLASILLVVVVTGALLAARRRWPAGLATWLAYGVALAPVLGLVQVWRQIVAERYSYVACLGFALLAGGAVLRLSGAWRGRDGDAPRFGAVERATPRTRFIAVALGASALLGALVLQTRREVQAWRNTESLWQHALVANPENYVALYNLGVEYAGRQDFANAVEMYDRALAARPDLPNAHAGLGTAQMALGRWEDAARHLDAAAAENPRDALALTNLAAARARLRDYAGALDAADRAIALSPNAPEAHANRGAALHGLARYGDAAASYREATRLVPTSREAWRGLGHASWMAGRRTDAVAALREAVALDSLDTESANMLAWTLATSDDATLRNGAEAVLLAERALRVRGESIRVARTLGANDSRGYLVAGSAELRAAAIEAAQRFDTYAAALAEAGRFDEAVAAAENAAAIAREGDDALLAKEFNARAASYRSGKPFREAVPE
ncbi:MAG: tetratricopeptide repeat protein [bacterium]